MSEGSAGPCCGSNRNSAESIQMMDPTVNMDLSVNSRATVEFLCAFSVQTPSSATAAHSGTLNTDRLLIRGLCMVTAGPKKILDDNWDPC